LAVPDSLVAAAGVFGESLAAFDPGLYSGEDCAVIVRSLSAVVNACEAARALAAARAAECGAHRARGFLDADEWFGREAGVTSSQARRDRHTAELAREHPKTAEAMKTGQVSLGQAAEITRTAKECPDAEDELLTAAAKVPLPVLRDTARRLREQAMDAGELHARRRRARSFRHWRDELGMVRFAGGLIPEIGVPFINRLEVETGRLRRAAAGEREPWEASAADAFAAMINPAKPTSSGQSSTRRPTSADVVLVCDLNPFRRGHAEPGEVCHIIGGGRTTVDVVRHHLEQDAFLKAVLHDGVKIDTIKHFGRYINAELRTALTLGAPPLFAGPVCDCGCGRTRGLQIDHIDPVANQGPTEFQNLRPLTGGHHRIKTADDRNAGLLTGNRRTQPKQPGTTAAGQPGPPPSGQRGPPPPTTA
jgi:hypothetical protein